MSDEGYWLERAERLKQENIALDNELKELKETNRTTFRTAPGRDRAIKLAIVFSACILNLIFIGLTFARGEFLFAFVGLIVLSLPVWLFYYFYKQPIR